MNLLSTFDVRMVKEEKTVLYHIVRYEGWPLLWVLAHELRIWFDSTYVNAHFDNSKDADIYKKHITQS